MKNDLLIEQAEHDLVAANLRLNTVDKVRFIGDTSNRLADRPRDNATRRAYHDLVDCLVRDVVQAQRALDNLLEWRETSIRVGTEDELADLDTFEDADLGGNA